MLFAPEGITGVELGSAIELSDDGAEVLVYVA